MNDVLTQICADKRDHVAACKQRRPLAELEAEARKMPPVRGFRAGLQAAVEASGVGLIAEIKRASPSKGLIREDFDPTELARAYRAGGWPVSAASIAIDAVSRSRISPTRIVSGS